MCKTFSKPLPQTFYKIKQTGIFLNISKVSTVSPTFKKDCKSVVENYRQVSLLTHASKILERCFYLDLYEHFEPIVSLAQFRFRNGVLVFISFLLPSRRSLKYWRNVNKSIWYIQSMRTAYCCENSTNVVFEANS